MKHTFKYISAVLIGLVFAASCEDLNRIEFGSADSSGEISVKYSQGGAEVKSLSYGAGSRVVTVDVAVNNEDLKWNMVSDADWIRIAEEDHRGSGSFTFTVAYNPTFDPRETATLTFVAGQFEGFRLTVDQKGNVFILGSAYHIASSAQGTATLTVSAPVAYNIVSDEWIEVETVSQNETTSDLTLSWDANTQAARYGRVGFVLEGEEEADASFDIFQMGNETSFSADGDIQLAAENAQVLEILMPANTLEGVEGLDDSPWVKYTSEITGTQEKISFTFQKNISDCKKVRTASLALKIKDYDTPVILPDLSQTYAPAFGLVSAEGMQMFAQAWNSGDEKALKDWKDEEGTFILKRNVDFTGLTGWTSIGTEDRPFTGSFDGNYFHIQNMQASCPIFGVCKGAVIRNINIDDTCVFFQNQQDSQVPYYCISALAAEVTSGVFHSCHSRASVYAKFLADKETYMAGLIGKVNKAEDPAVQFQIKESSNDGPVTFEGTFGQKAFIGGCIGHCAVEIDGEDKVINSGAVTWNSPGGFGTDKGVSMGGVFGALAAGTKNVVNKGRVLYTDSSTETGKSLYLGGISGQMLDIEDLRISGCTNSGEIHFGATGDARAYSDVHIGGVLGYSGLPVTISGCSNSGLVKVEKLKAKVEEANKYIGGIVGYLYVSESASASSLVTGCTNTGIIYHDDYTTSASPSKMAVTGGIAGRLRGQTGNRIKVEECSSNPTDDFGGYLGARRGALGGIIGYTQYVDISDCHCKIEEFQGTAFYYGGICGVFNNSTMVGCTATSLMTDLALYTLEAIGGLAGRFANTTVVENCSYIGSISSGKADAALGGLAGVIENNATIKSSRFGGYINNVEMTADKLYGAIAEGAVLTTPDEYPNEVVK